MYIIKKHYEATDINKNFAGDVRDYYEGKRGHLLSQHDQFPSEWNIREYGYKTLAAAKKGLKVVQELCEWEEQKGYWKVSAEIIEV